MHITNLVRNGVARAGPGFSDGRVSNGSPNPRNGGVLPCSPQADRHDRAVLALAVTPTAVTAATPTALGPGRGTGTDGKA